MDKCCRMIWSGDSVCDWADDWKMSFNTDKCKVVHYGKGSINFKYRMHGQMLGDVISEKDGCGVFQGFESQATVRRSV